MTHELDIVRARAPRSLPDTRMPRGNSASRAAARLSPRARSAMALIPRLGRSPTHAAIRILETTWRLWREPSISTPT